MIRELNRAAKTLRRAEERYDETCRELEGAECRLAVWMKYRDDAEKAVERARERVKQLAALLASNA